jgi:hypothetical protein
MHKKQDLSSHLSWKGNPEVSSYAYERLKKRTQTPTMHTQFTETLTKRALNQIGYVNANAGRSIRNRTFPHTVVGRGIQKSHHVPPH